MHGIGFVLVFAVLFGIYAYKVRNTLIRLNENCKEAWRDTEFALKYRYDLMESFSTIFSQKMPQTRNVLETLAESITHAKTCAGEMKQISRAESELSQTLYKTFALLEANPAFQTDATFVKFQKDIHSAHEKIEDAARFYNGNVLTYNTEVGNFPSNIVAAMFHFEPKTLFEPKLTKEEE